MSNFDPPLGLRIVLAVIVFSAFVFASLTLYQIGEDNKGNKWYKGRAVVDEETACFLAENFFGGVTLCQTDYGTEVIYDFNTRTELEYLDYKKDEKIRPFVYTAAGWTGLFAILGSVGILTVKNEEK